MQISVSTFTMNGHPWVIAYSNTAHLKHTLGNPHQFLKFVDLEELEASMATAFRTQGFSMRERPEFDAAHSG